MRRWTLGTAGAALIVLVAAGAGAWLLQNVVGPKGSGYHAKILCSGVFVGKRSADHVNATDLGRFWYVQGKVDAERQRVTSDLFGFGKTTAVFRPGLGCTVARGVEPDVLQRMDAGLPAPRPTRALAWPTGDVGAEATLPEPHAKQLDDAIAAAFREPDPTKMARRTRAVVVVHHGRIVGERYGVGFGRETPLVGWSMTKSVTATLVALAGAEGLLDVSAQAPVSAWQAPGDPRAAITLDQLLRMSSGLEFSEVYGAFGDATQMLFVTPDAASYAASRPLEHPPDTVWSYSSGTTNIVQGVLRDAVGPERYLRFPREALFDRIGMQSAVIEPDASGTFVGSSFMLATARDWARFGLLHLDDGVWEGERVLPQGWVDYITTPTPPAPIGEYGAHWWLNQGAPADPAQRRFPSLPRDAYQASGFEGQAVLVIPSRQVVIVRLGLTPAQEPEVWDLDAFAASILAALPDGPPPEAAPVQQSDPPDVQNPDTR
jgi:CubicO group peptidase (beta-lactamase class C family)